MADDTQANTDKQAKKAARAKLRAKLESAAEAMQTRRRDIANGLLTDNLSLADRVQALGFNAETARVFDLLPVVHVAWADGEVQAEEREALMTVLEVRGVEPGSAGFQLLSALLEKHPGQAYINESLAVIRELVAENSRRAEALVDLCFVIAEAHGAGFLGLRDPIDGNERQALEAVAEALGDRATQWLRAKFGQL